jgi:hypothetical protein
VESQRICDFIVSDHPEGTSADLIGHRHFGPSLLDCCNRRNFGAANSIPKNSSGSILSLLFAQSLQHILWINLHHGKSQQIGIL